MLLYQNILDGGISKPSKRMSMPAAALPSLAKPQPLVVQKHCNSCSKQIFQRADVVYVPTVVVQAKVFVEPGKPTIIYCEKCYIERFTKGNCPSCFKPVMSKTDPYITHNKRSWHTACFVCYKCRKDICQDPMVDLRGRPCCEGCLMAQAGADNQSSNVEDSSTPADRSITGSPAPLPSRAPYAGSDIADTDDRPHLSLSRLDLNLDRNNALMTTNSPSPLSAHSSSSQSSFAASLRQTGSASSGYTSGSSSTYSSLGRRRADSTAATPSSHSAGLNGSPHLTFQRPGSALSIHSYTSSRPSSPVPSEQEQEQRHSRAPSQSSSSVGVSQLDLSDSRSSSRSEIYGRRTPVLERYPQALSAEVDVVASAADRLRTSALPERRTEQQLPPSKPKLTRVRSRSSVGPTTAGMVRARTEAWMSQTQSSNTPSATSSRYGSQVFTHSNSLFADRRYSTAFAGTAQKQPTAAREKEVKEIKEIKEPKESKNVGTHLESEPSRGSSLHRHGRQRSNTVGEAISLPAVQVDSLASSTLQRAAIPENHCQKCLEKVTENGIRLQNGDRFHIGCFLCHGCKQVFTESEFHIVFGRPYHPSCVSLAGTTGTNGLITKCQQCHKIIGNKSIRFAGLNYHPQCFTCTHCHDVLHSTSRFFEVDGRVECERCCQERDRERLAPKIVPVARAADHFPVPPMVIPVVHSGAEMEPSGPGMMANTLGANGNLSRSGSGYGSPLSVSGRSSPSQAPGSPLFSAASLNGDLRQLEGNGANSPVLMMASPLVVRSQPPALTSLFSTRTRPLPKFGGVTNCPRCQQPVGVMDQVPGPKNEKWHKKCLHCKECKK
ncbi:hypothetical protein EC968_003426 [Mortierella alpina]|nr:hypothetical protein EC968_003426 [Mortierella alpina]